jgi:acyl transferase domain-containing protein
MLMPAQALSPVGRCRTFDAAADGYGRGEGIAVIVLQASGDSMQQSADAADAPGSGSMADVRQQYAVLRGSVTNQGGRSGGLTAPNGPAQGALVR